MIRQGFGARGVGGGHGVNVCGMRKSKKSSPNDSCKSSADERKSLLGRKNVQGSTMNTHIMHLFS